MASPTGLVVVASRGRDRVTVYFVPNNLFPASAENSTIREVL